VQEKVYVRMSPTLITEMGSGAVTSPLSSTLAGGALATPVDRRKDAAAAARRVEKSMVKLWMKFTFSTGSGLLVMSVRHDPAYIPFASITNKSHQATCDRGHTP
jgi:hypothetical protein